MRISDNTIIEIIEKNNLIDASQLSMIRAEAGRTSQPLQDILLKSQLVTEEDLTRHYAEMVGIPFIVISPNSLTREILGIIPERIARQYNAVIFKIDEDGTTHIAMDDPDDIQATNFISKEIEGTLKVYIAPHQNILDCLDKYRGDVSEEISQVIDFATEDEAESQSDVDTTLLAEDSPIAQTVNLLLDYAVRANASDIHIEPREGSIQVRYRIDGVLKEVNKLPKKSLGSLVSRIKILANLKIDEHRVPQDGRFKMNLAGRKYALRVSTLPVADGEKVVLRILNETSNAVSLQELGFWGPALTKLNEAIVQPDGMVLVTGPTGSGKSTTLFSILTTLNKPEVNISTIEDPIEYKISGVNQTQTNPLAGMTFANGLRSLLRQDPNIIMVGEIRDSETASLGVQAALTGHLVFTTLHTNNAATSLPRLLDMEIEPFLIASTVKAVVGQRLVRRLCMHCRIKSKPDEAEVQEVIKMFSSSGSEGINGIHSLESTAQKSGVGGETPLSTTTGQIETIWRPNPEGCQECNHTGYYGRIGIYETLTSSENIRKLIMAGATSDQIQDQAIKEGMLTMQTDGMTKVLRGETSIAEVMRVTKE